MNMIIYHGSNILVDKPQILKPKRGLDFGEGFYTTTNRTQAISFADKVTKRRKSGSSIISVYEIDDSGFDLLKVLHFEGANEAWLDFVSENRSGKKKVTNDDLVFGPVADDDVYQTFILYTNEVLTKEQTIEALKVKELYNQLVFITEKSLSYLKFVKFFSGSEVQ